LPAPKRSTSINTSPADRVEVAAVCLAAVGVAANAMARSIAKRSTTRDR
jgi:hypothetical protein